MLDDGDRDIRKVRDERPGGLGVEQVVVGEFDPLPLPGARDTATGGGPVERGRLMGILAVAEVAQLVAAEGEVLRQRCRRIWPAKVLPDGGVVGGGMTEGDRGKMTSKRRRNTARVLERGKDGRIIARPHHWKDVVVVLRRRAQQGHAADIDRLDGLRAVGTGGHRLHEGIEIDHH